MNERRRTVWTFVVTSAALFMGSLDNLVVTTALPSIRAHLHASLAGLQWTVNAYTLTFAVLLLTGATLGERYGRRRVFVAGLGLFTAGSAAAALAPTIGWLITARAVQGVGAAIVIPLTLTLLSAAVPPQRRGRGRRLLAVDLLAERADRHRAAADRQGAADRKLRPGHAPGYDRPGSREPGVARHRARRGAGQRPRLDQRDRAAADRVRCPARGGLHRLGVAGTRTDAPPAPVPQPRLRRHQRRIAADVLRHVRRHLPARSVPADGAALLAAAGWVAHPAVDRDAGLRRADRGRAVGPHRRPTAAGRRSGPAGDRSRLAGRGEQP